MGFPFPSGWGAHSLGLFELGDSHGTSCNSNLHAYWRSGWHFYGTTAPSTTGWTEYTAAVDLPTESGQTVKVRAFAVKALSDNSEVASTTFYTIGFSGAVGANAVAILDTNSTQGLGSVCEGTGKSGADGTSIGGRRIGAASTTTDLKYETGTI